MRAIALVKPLGNGRQGLAGVILEMTVAEALTELAKAAANARDTNNTSWPDIGAYLRDALRVQFPDVTDVELSAQVTDANHAYGGLRTWAAQVAADYASGARPAAGQGVAHGKP